MKTFNDYLEMADKTRNAKYISGKTYVYTYNGKNPLKVKFIGERKNRKDISLANPNSEIGDVLTDPATLLFRWLDGDGVPSSHGKKGDVVALGKKEAAKNIKEID